ncbi:MAG TPA: MBL fold metallo-hydrolase [Acidobacteriota bacterium]|nr:MBL fold metallo-hydrolase [Acidobacteriota bacterium]
MVTRIVFLGTAGDSIVMGKQLRASGGIYFEHESLKLLINPGPGTLVRAKQFDIALREIDGVLVTHSSILSSNDVNATVDAITNGGLDKKGVVVSTPAALDGSATISPLLSSSSVANLEKIVRLNIGDKVALNDIEIMPTPTQHSDPSRIGFMLICPEVKISYVGDSAYAKKLVRAHAQTDVLIVNLPNLTAKTDSMGVAEATQLISEIQPGIAIITGFGIKVVEADILNIVRNIQQQTKVQTVAAKDGLSIDPQSYVKLTEQTKLQ